MIKLFAPLALGALLISGAAQAKHALNTDVPFPTRGACEAERAELSNDDDFLLEVYPQLFSSPGEVRSFLNMAFTCEQDPSDGQWYITDHRQEVLNSEWFQRRL